jgi:hypothetical protein
MAGLNLTPDKLKAAAPVVLPLVALYVLKLTSGPAPTFAQQLIEDHAAAPTVRLATPSTESLRCAQWEAEVRRQPCGDSPFFYSTDEGSVYDDEPEAQVERPAGRPNVVLEGVMGSGSRAMALINGRLLGLGDAVEGGWTIESIDVAGRTAMLVDAAGNRHKLESQ